MASLDDQTQVGRKGTSITSTSSLLIGIRGGHIVCKFTRALEHLTLAIRTILVFHFLSHHTRFIRSVRYTDKVTPCNAIKRMASRANFTVHLVAATDTEFRILMSYRVEPRKRSDSPGMVERIEGALVGPWVCGRMETLVTEVACVHFTNEGKGTVEVGIPCY